MAQAVGRSPFSFLNTDGRAHPRENLFAVAALVLGLVAIITANWPGLHLFSSWFGLVGIVTAAWGQFISATTAERFLTIIGLGTAAVGFYLGLAHGGLIS
jgi:hypothetical protein